MIINSRPLSYVTPDDLEEPLTPSHFLTGKRTMSIPDGLSTNQDWDEDIQITIPELSRRMRHLNTILNHFWKRWKGEYLLELRESHRYGCTGVQNSQVSAGDIVLVLDEVPRAVWRLAKVEEVLTGRDGLSRGAVVRVTAKKRSKVLRRPIQRLYLLETNCKVEAECSGSNEDNTITESDEIRCLVTACESASSARDRTKRAAAIVGPVQYMRTSDLSM